LAWQKKNKIREEITKAAIIKFPTGLGQRLSEVFFERISGEFAWLLPLMFTQKENTAIIKKYQVLL